ncbi:MAG TPA: hypothetical protein VK157_01250 [Phycisphaerales bacterium]|nr:hypothetical protein [Phycisphaerales bacterium]
MSLARNLGLFFGHIAKAVANDPTAPRSRGSAATGPGKEPPPQRDEAPTPREVARREMTATTIVHTAEGPREVVLRRTVIDEVAAAEPLDGQTHASQAGQQSPPPRQNPHGASDIARDAGEHTKFPR